MFAKGKMGKVVFVAIAGLMILTLGFSSGVYYCQSTYEPVTVEKYIYTGTGTALDVNYGHLYDY